MTPPTTPSVRDALASKGFDRVARCGYVAKGTVFGTIGLLAGRAAWVGRAAVAEEDADVTGVFEALAGAPGTVWLLALLAAGLLAYALWRFVQAVGDAEGEGRGPVGYAKRAIYLGIGLTYLGFAAYALAAIGGLRSEREVGDWTAEALGLPGGGLVVGLVGLAVIVGGLNELRFGVTFRFKAEFRTRRMHRVERILARVLGLWGHVSRGVVYTIAGAYAIRTAITFDPEEARGMGETFGTLAAGPGGTVGLALVALGFVAFGLYYWMLAVHREIPNQQAVHGGLEGRVGKPGPG